MRTVRVMPTLLSEAEDNRAVKPGKQKEKSGYLPNLLSRWRRENLLWNRSNFCKMTHTTMKRRVRLRETPVKRNSNSIKVWSWTVVVLSYKL